jgi:hypothetical protein
MPVKTSSEMPTRAVDVIAVFCGSNFGARNNTVNMRASSGWRWHVRAWKWCTAAQQRLKYRCAQMEIADDAVKDVMNINGRPLISLKETPANPKVACPYIRFRAKSEANAQST